MLRPSYSDLIDAVNSAVEPGEEPVVQSLPCVVEDRAVGGFRYDFFQREGGVRASGEQGVEVVDIGFVVFAVMVFECFFAHGGRQCVEGVGQGRHFVFADGLRGYGQDGRTEGQGAEQQVFFHDFPFFGIDVSNAMPDVNDNIVRT